MKALFAGTFDPFTIGHLDIVTRAATHFDELFVSILYNPGKETRMFTVEQSEELIKEAVLDIPNVTVCHYNGLLVEQARLLGANCIIRGIRNGSDVEYERMLEAVNRKLDDKIETMYLLSKPEHSHISSSLVRQLISLGISIEDLVPNPYNVIYKKERT